MRENDSECPGIAGSWVAGFQHYPSLNEHLDEAHKEWERYVSEDIVVELDEAELLRHFPQAHLNKLGVIVKTTPGGTTTVRLIVDMRRSGANARAD
eukprot:10590996-Heterocapsa_arctica.AAC.1